MKISSLYRDFQDETKEVRNNEKQLSISLCFLIIWRSPYIYCIFINLSVYFFILASKEIVEMDIIYLSVILTWNDEYYQHYTHILSEE